MTAHHIDRRPKIEYATPQELQDEMAALRQDQAADRKRLEALEKRLGELEGRFEEIDSGKA